MLKYTLYIFAFLLTFSAFAQEEELSTSKRRAKKFYYQAQEHFSNRRFDEGIESLKDAIRKDEEFTDAYVRLGSAYKTLGEDSNAHANYLRACKLEPENPKTMGAFKNVADYFFAEGDYEKAQEYYTGLLNLKPNRKDILNQVQDRMERCAFGLEAKKDPVTFEPVKMSENINQFFIHAYPVLTADQNTLIFSKRNGPYPSDDENIMVSNKQDSGEWGTPRSISDNINTRFNEGACTMSGDGKTLVFTSCNRKDGVGSCDLYISYLEGDQWSVPENMGKGINSNVWDSEPSLSADGNTLYFSSERKGGEGEYDIWYTQRKEDGSWTKAQNMGSPVNTEGNEVSSFIHADGKTLYFSSDSHMGMGEYDIFIAKQLENGEWSEPENIGYPVNDHASNTTVFISADNKKGIYSVYQKKGMQYSPAYLYEFDVPEEMQPENVSTYARGSVYDAETKKPIKASVKLIDLNTSKTVQRVTSDPVTGEYLAVLTEGTEYGLYVESTGYLYKSKFFDFAGQSSFDPVKLDVYLDPVKQGNSVVLNNIFFESNKFALKDKSRTELDRIALFLKQNPDVRIEFGGHTDNVGTHKDNMELSLQRARAVYNYMTEQGVSPSRMKYKGYGETKPVATNETEEGRKENRRIEFRVL